MMTFLLINKFGYVKLTLAACRNVILIRPRVRYFEVPIKTFYMFNDSLFNQTHKAKPILQCKDQKSNRSDLYYIHCGLSLGREA